MTLDVFTPKPQIKQKATCFMKKYIGDRAFYKSVLTLIIPMIIQQSITTLVNLLDNVMVGTLGTEAISSVAIVNQLIFVFNILIFGAVSGASIYGAQFYGKEDYEGYRHAVRFKLYLGIVVCAISTVVFLLYGENLISLYLSESADGVGDLALTMAGAKDYLAVSIIAFIPFMLSQSYSTSLREAGETMTPMVAGTIAILVNLTLNYLLIFGHFGFPELGVKGAAIATTISRFVEMFYIMYVTHTKKLRFHFMVGVYSKLTIPLTLIKRISVTAAPLFANELLWAIGIAMVSQSYSVRGITIMAAINISSTVASMFMVVLYSLGQAVSIMVGQELGAGNIEKAKDTVRKLIFFNVALYIGIALVIIVLSPYIPHIYNVEDSVKAMASSVLIAYSVIIPVNAFNNSAYFTMRSGGKTWLTFIFDAGIIWFIKLPTAFFLVRYTNMDIVMIYFLAEASNFVKAAIGGAFLKSGKWANNLVENT